MLFYGGYFLFVPGYIMIYWVLFRSGVLNLRIREGTMGTMENSITQSEMSAATRGDTDAPV